MNNLDRAQISRKVFCKFTREQGIDEGGLRREMFTNGCKEIFNPKFGLFKIAANGFSLEIDPASQNIPFYLKYFEYAGILLAKTIVD